ncbi:MAG: hypothetical protein QUU85_10880 [Candidatus Eisenbacteria bacterium]|nr:hypothetical protein [Candidatus Eisenbacteria bacterium]
MQWFARPPSPEEASTGREGLGRSSGLKKAGDPHTFRSLLHRRILLRDLRQDLQHVLPSRRPGCEAGFEEPPHVRAKTGSFTREEGEAESGIGEIDREERLLLQQIGCRVLAEPLARSGEKLNGLAEPPGGAETIDGLAQGALQREAIATG